ncbi:hypothetical protein ACSBR2_017949 [Camellia fascicularis]
MCRKRHSTSSHDNSVSKLSGTRILYDGQSIERWPNTALFLEDIKQEVESFDADQLEETPSKTQSALWRKSLAGNSGVYEADVATDSIRRPGSYSLKSCKHEDDALLDGGDTTFTLFASLLDSALQGNEELPKDLMLVMHLLWLTLKFSIMFSCSFIWLEGLASKVLDLDNEVRRSHVGTYLPSSRVWRHTQRALKKGVSKPKAIHHLDFDAPTLLFTSVQLWNHALYLYPMPFILLDSIFLKLVDLEDFFSPQQKQDESLLEDVWTLLRASRLEEACELCWSAGQICKKNFEVVNFLSHCDIKFRLGSHGELQLYAHLEGWTYVHQLKPW